MYHDQMIKQADYTHDFRGGRSAPLETFDREISADLQGKERQGKKGKWSRKEGKSKKGRWKIENGRKKGYQMRRGLFFPLLKTTEMLWVYQNGNFLPAGKRHFTPGKKIRKNDFAPLKIFLLRPYMISKLIGNSNNLCIIEYYTCRAI